jgi:CBS domain-containing protein
VDRKGPSSSKTPDGKKQRSSPKADYLQGETFRSHIESRAFHAKDIMTQSPISISPQSGILEIQTLMQQKRFRHLPVVNSEGLLLGIVSERDVLKAVSKPLREPKDILASDLMGSSVMAATPDTLLIEIAQMLLSENKSALPIIDAESKLVGILTTTDILKGLLKRAPIELWV